MRAFPAFQTAADNVSTERAVVDDLDRMTEDFNLK
jgi:hypothetical protein